MQNFVNRLIFLASSVVSHKNFSGMYESEVPLFAQDEQIKATLENGHSDLIVTFPKTFKQAFKLPELAPKKIVIQTSDKEDYDSRISRFDDIETYGQIC
jgi:hypothetical protein